MPTEDANQGSSSRVPDPSPRTGVATDAQPSDLLGAGPSGVVLPDPRRVNWFWRAAIAASLLAHGALIAFAVMHFSSPPGGKGTRLEGIEVTTISAEAFESHVRSLSTGGGSDRPVSAAEGDAAADKSAATTSPPASAAEAKPSLSLLTSKDLEAATAVAAAPEAKPVETQLEESPRPAATAADAAPPETSQHQALSGGALTQAPASSTAQAAATSASPGEVARFAADVRNALSKSRPRQGWPSGKLLVAFTVTELGQVADAELLRASGNTRLDTLTLGWIRSAHMPIPPAGMTPADRRYSIPLTIR